MKNILIVLVAVMVLLPIGVLENKTVNISEKEKLPIADNKDDHTYIIIGGISSIIAIIISVYVIIRNRKLSRKL